MVPLTGQTEIPRFPSTTTNLGIAEPAEMNDPFKFEALRDIQIPKIYWNRREGTDCSHLRVVHNATICKQPTLRNIYKDNVFVYNIRRSSLVYYRGAVQPNIDC